jgi:hypothetical protein
MKTKKSRSKVTPQTKPLTRLVWIDINASNPAVGVRNPVAYGFVDPELLKFLNAFGLQSQYTTEAISKSCWEEVTR